MPLGCDATIIYAMKLAGTYEGRLGKADLRMESPYNSYLHRNLPPGPICNPGVVSLRAALNPARTDYYYYVSRNDGTHQFSKDYRSHSLAVYKYQQSPARNEKPELKFVGFKLFLHRRLRILYIFRAIARISCAQKSKSFEACWLSPIVVRCFSVQRFIFIHIQHMKEMLRFRTIERTIQGQAVIPLLTGILFHIYMLGKHASYGIIADIHVTDFSRISTDCHRKFLSGRQPVIYPVCCIFWHTASP